MKSIRIALAQINTTVGDLAGNARTITEGIEQGRELGVNLIAFPELAVTGYPPEDLLLMPRFVQQNLKMVDEITKATKGLTALVGFVDSG